MTDSVANPSFRKLKRQKLFELSNKEYLERFHIRRYFQDAVEQIVQHEPDVALQFLNEYFSNVVSGQHILFREFKFVNATPYNRLCFIRKFKEAFSGFEDDTDLSLDEFHQLVCLLCSDFPFSLLRNASRIAIDTSVEHVLVKFGAFSTKLFLLFFFCEFMNQCALEFRSLDTDATGRVDRHEFFDSLVRIVKEKEHVFSCPTQAIVEEVVLGMKETDKDELMFNEFCVRLFSSRALTARLKIPISSSRMKAKISEFLAER